MAGSLSNMFDFSQGHGRNGKLLLDPVTGQPA
jgi:hypothetical protein